VGFKLKVVHLLACPLASGAGRAVETLHRGLLDTGIDSTLTGRLEKGLPSELRAERLPLHDRLTTNLVHRAQRRLNRLRYGADNDMGFLQIGSDFSRVRAFRAADIIHIQWANSLSMGSRFWNQISVEKRPIVWTLRDMWPITGGCHFNGDCRNFEKGCGGCPKLDSVTERITTWDLNYKKSKLPDNLTFTAISDNFAREIRRAHALSGREVRVIPNSVDVEKFSRIDPRRSRTALGLPTQPLIISAGAVNIASPRKGAHIIERLLKRYSTRKEVFWSLFGGNCEQLNLSGAPNLKLFGMISDDMELNSLYSGSDIFLMPSLQESFGKTTIEAMASGTPVIAFRDTPAEEMIVHGESGWLVTHGDLEQFTAAVDSAMALDRNTLSDMGRAARARAIQKYSLRTVVEQHIELYSEKLEESKMLQA